MFDHLKLQNSKNWKKRKLLEAANRTFQIRKYRTCQSFKISIKIGNRQVAQRRRDRNWNKWSGSAIWRGKVLPCYNRKDNEDTHQNLANNSDAVGTTLRIFHKSWRSLSLGAKLHPFVPDPERELTCIIQTTRLHENPLACRWEKVFPPLFPLLFLFRDACTHESFKFCSLRVMEHSRRGTPMPTYRPRPLSFFHAIQV